MDKRIDSKTPQDLSAKTITSEDKIDSKINWKNILVAIIILASIFSLTYGAWHFSQNKKQTTITETPIDKSSLTPVKRQTDATIDWITFTNDKYGYSFKFPAKWNVSPLNDYLERPDPKFPNAGAVQSICSGINSCPFSLEISSEKIDQKVLEFTTSNTKQDPSFVISVGDTNDQGILGKKVVTKGSQPDLPGIHYFYPRNGKVYTIDVDVTGLVNPTENYAQALKILSTFKFL